MTTAAAVETGGLVLQLDYEHRYAQATIIAGPGTTSTRNEPAFDIYDLEYVARQLRCAFQALWDVFGLEDPELVKYAKYGAEPFGWDPRFATVSSIEIGSLRLLLRIPAAIVGSPLAALIALLERILELDIKLHTHALRRDRERLELSIEVERLRRQYDQLLRSASAGDRPDSEPKLVARDAHLLDAGS